MAYLYTTKTTINQNNYSPSIYDLYDECIDESYCHCYLWNFIKNEWEGILFPIFLKKWKKLWKGLPHIF